MANEKKAAPKCELNWRDKVWSHIINTFEGFGSAEENFENLSIEQIQKQIKDHKCGEKNVEPPPKG